MGEGREITARTLVTGCSLMPMVTAREMRVTPRPAAAAVGSLAVIGFVMKRWVFYLLSMAVLMSCHSKASGSTGVQQFSYDPNHPVYKLVIWNSALLVNGFAAGNFYNVYCRNMHSSIPGFAEPIPLARSPCSK